MKPTINSLVFEVTHDCNYKCKYCYNHWKADTKFVPAKSDYKTAKKTLRKLFGTAKINQITFSGGEPLLAERFEELVLFCKLHKTNVSLITNSWYLSSERIEQLISLKISGFQIPFLSSNPEIHDKLTQKSGSWEKSIESIRKIQKLGGSVVPVVVLTKLNLQSLAETLKFLAENNCNRIMLNRFNIGGLGIANKTKLELNHNELKNAFALANKIAKKHNLLIQSGVCSPICILNPKDFPNIRFAFCNNDLMHRPITVDFQGNVRYCNHSPTEMGNIHKTTFSEILQSEQNAQKYNSIPEECTNCDDFNRCKAGCRAASEQLGSDFSVADPILLVNKTRLHSGVKST